MEYFIYQRVSTEKQSLSRQEGQIADYCKENNIVVPPENIYSDIITGKTIQRTGYQAMKARLQKEDVLIILDLDRLGRNWDIIKDEWRELTDKGVYIIVVNVPLINVLPEKDKTVSLDKRLIQEMMFTLLCYISQKEVEKISQRTKEALEVRRQQGIQLGHPVKYTPEQDARALALVDEGYTYTQVAEITGINRNRVCKVVANRKKGVIGE